MEETSDDPELEAIRARLRQQLIDRRRPPVPTAPADVGPVALTAASFASFVAEHPRVMVDVWAPWCGPCRALAPVIDALARRFADDVRFGKLNADEAPEVVARFGIEGIPTQLLFLRGKLVDRVVGVQPHEALAGRIQRSLRVPSSPSETEER